MKKSILLSIFIFQLSTTFSWGVVGKYSEEEYRELSINFPSVGYFARDEVIPFGSGVLIDTNLESLNGRVVLTAAHVFNNELDVISFHIGEQKRSGYAIIHPEYRAFMKKIKPYDIPYFPYDIALYLLDEPIHGVPLTVLNFNLSFEDLLRNKWFVNCGFGISGQLDNPSIETDTNRRACYSYASQKLNATGANEATVSFCHKQEDLAIKEIDVKYPAGSVLTLTPDCFLEPCGSVAPGDSGGGVFLAEGGQLIGIIVGTSKVEMLEHTPINSLLSSHLHLEDDSLEAAYKERSVLVGFHREWLKDSLDLLAKESIPSNLYLIETNEFTADIETIGLNTNVSLGQHSCEFSGTTFPISEATMLRALQAKCYWTLVNDRALPEDIRFVAAMNLFESTNEAIQAKGCNALLTLSMDPGIYNVYRDMAASTLLAFPSSCKMGIKAYKCIAEDTTAAVTSRIDAAVLLISSLNDLYYRNLGVDIYLDLAENDHRIDENNRFANGVMVLLGIKDRKVGAFVIYKLQGLLEDEHTPSRKKEIIQFALLTHHLI